MKTFTSITKSLRKRGIPFESIEFTDVAVSARTRDTSISKNYDPTNAIKTLVITTKIGLMGVILRGDQRIDKTKLNAIVGKWSVVKGTILESHVGYMPGTVCPLELDLPMLIDTKATKMNTWSMGAGDITRGLNVATKDCLPVLKNARIAEFALTDEAKGKSWYSKGDHMDEIEHLLTRGVDAVYPTREALEKVLRSGKKLTLYQGFDPTGTQLHIGHAVGFRKLRQWQDLGHHVIFLIGDGTGLAGDPSGKMKARGRFMSRQELRDNAKEYLMQAAKIVRFEGENPIEIRYNGDWLTKLQLEDILNIAQNFTVQQMIERDMYQVRMKAGDPINLREFLYPLLQGYDSVAMNVDLELGGSDQMFNMLAGRTLVKAMLGKEKFVMTVPLLADSKGMKIGKTEGNVIGLTDPPNDFYGKIMSLGDDAIIPCFTLLTDTPKEEIDAMKKSMESGSNPMEFKKRLAFELTKWLNDENSAKTAQKEFETRFQEGRVGDAELPEIPLNKLFNVSSMLDTLVLSGISESNSVARRLIDQNAVKINDQLITSAKEKPVLKPGDIIKAGRKAVKVGK